MAFHPVVDGGKLCVVAILCLVDAVEPLAVAFLRLVDANQLSKYLCEHGWGVSWESKPPLLDMVGATASSVTKLLWARVW